MATDLCVRVGRKIRILRTQREWTQIMLADHASLTREHIAELEAGRKEAGIRTLARIAEAFELTLSEFFKSI